MLGATGVCQTFTAEAAGGVSGRRGWGSTTEAISGPLRGSDAQRFFGNVLEPVLPAPRPWWKLWGKEEREPELPAIVADLRNAA